MWYSLFRLRYPRNSGLRDAFREVVWPILPETPLQLWVQTQTCRARSGPDILARDIIAALGLQMLGPDLVRPVSLETSSQFQTQICPDLRWSGPVHLGDILATLVSEMPGARWSSQFSLRCPRNSGLPDVARRVVLPFSLPASSQFWAPPCRARKSCQLCPKNPRNSGLRDSLVWPFPPETSSQLWAQACRARG